MNKMRYLQRTRNFFTLGLASIFAVLALQPVAVYADPPNCAEGKAQTIIAHPDDDLLFINPVIQQDITAGKCVETISVTSGDAGLGSTFWQSRENGLMAAYATMAGVSNTWAQTNLTLLGKSVQLFTLQNKPEVTLLFMRIPNGGEYTENSITYEGYPSTNYKTLKKLWQNTVTTATTVDSASTYTRQDVIDVLATRMATYGATTIRTLDYTIDFGEDHKDHQAVAYFARAAHQQATLPAHTFSGYEAYLALSRSTNVTGTDLTNKQNAFFTYNAYDDNTCTAVVSCDANRLGSMARHYVAGSESGASNRWDWETVDGDSGSWSGYSADVGNQPATVSFGGNPYVFYYDATAGDIRQAKDTGSGWAFATLDGAGGSNGRISADVGRSPTVTVYNGWMNLFYYDATNGNLRHGMSNDGSTWYFQTLDGATGTTGGLNNDLGMTPKALVVGSALQLFYYDNSAGNLRHAYLNNNSWYFENLEGDSGSISGYDANIGLNVSVIEYQGTLQLFYYDVSGGNLRHAYADGSGWHFENLDGTSGSTLGFNTNTGEHPHAVLEGTTLHVFYYDATNGDLRHAWTSPTQSWTGENLMGDPNAVIRSDTNVGSMTEATMYGSELHVFTYEPGNGGKLVHLSKSGSNWKEEHLDGFGSTQDGGLEGMIGWEPTPIVYNSKLHVFYYDASSGNLRHIFRP